MLQGQIIACGSKSSTFCVRPRPRSTPRKIWQWQDLSPKLQQSVLSFLDYHTLLRCRLISKSLRSSVDKVIVESLKLDPILNWNPYFTSSKYADVKGQHGLVRFQGAEEVKQFIEKYDESEPAPASAAPPAPLRILTQALPNNTIRPGTPPPPQSQSCPRPSAHHRKCLLEAPTTMTPSPHISSKQKSSSRKVPPTTQKPIQSTERTSRALQQAPIRPKTAAPPSISNRTASSAFTKPFAHADPTNKVPLKPITSTMKAIPSASSSAPLKPAKTIIQLFAPPATHSPPQLTKAPPPSVLFPLGSVSIRRCLQDAEEDHQKGLQKQVVEGPEAEPNSTQQLVKWTNRLVHEYGQQLTSFTFDDGKGERSNLSFEQLHSMLSHLPNLVFLGITAGNYEHHVDYEELVANEEEVEKLPVLEHLKIVSLGYNASYHLHMDILNAYGCQLKRFLCSKFGYLLRSPFGYHISTNNSLQKLLEYNNSIKALYPDMLSSLEDLKVPLLSSQCLMREVEKSAAGPVPLIQWSNLKHLSLFYIHRGGEGYHECCLSDVWSTLNSFSSTLEELCLDFQSCSDFMEWLSQDPRPFPPFVYQACPKVRKICISAAALLQSEDMAGMISSKFPNLEVLTFFNWTAYYREAIQENNRQGYYGSGPTPVTIPGHVGYFWKDLPVLQIASVRTATWKDDCIYQKNRQEMVFVSKDEATYIF